jgi:pimeloyl-ACP methyl ester carboxylesterase
MPGSRRGIKVLHKTATAIRSNYPGRFTVSEIFGPRSRRNFLSTSAGVTAAAAAGSFGLLSAQPASAATGGASVNSSAGESIRPFPRIHFPERDLADLRRRIGVTRWPDKETVPDQTQGTQLLTAQQLARYWATKYDWRKCESELNALPMFLTQIDGLDIHFIHVRSRHENAMPLILTHGWPGSIIELLKVIRPLTDPTRYGASASDAFHVVIPSLPGFGFSGKPTMTGWDPTRIARAWIELMNRLGYAKYAAQGGDWGALIVDLMALQKPPALLGTHTNLPGVVPPAIDHDLQAGDPLPSGLSSEELAACAELSDHYKLHYAYAKMMGTRPQTLTGFADSPVGMAAFMLDHDKKSLALFSRVFAGQHEVLSPDDVLDDITVYWLTNTAVSAARLYWENTYSTVKTYSIVAAKGVTTPVAVSVFPDEYYQAPLSWAREAYPDLIYYHEAAKGGHFAAWEQPLIFSQEVRAGLRSLR